MSSSASSVSGPGAAARAAKRQRMIPGINPMMAGMNPFMAQMFPGFAQANGFSNMFGDQDYEDDVSTEAVTAENAAPTPVPGTVPSMSLVPSPAALPAVAEEDVHTRLSPDLAISRNVTYIKQAPRNRLAEACAICVPALDTGYTAPVEPGWLLVLALVGDTHGTHCEDFQLGKLGTNTFKNPEL